MPRFASAVVCGALVACAMHAAHAQDRQFRLLNPIPGPAAATGVAQSAVARTLTQAVPIPREVVERGVRELVSSWNTPGMNAALSEKFYDATRFTDAMDAKVPRDAKLTVQSVQGVQTLQQYVEPAAAGRSTLVSVVSATVRTQIEYNSASGFVRRAGTNELVLEVRQPQPLTLPDVLR